jgi:hypothetical protein
MKRTIAALLCLCLWFFVLPQETGAQGNELWNENKAGRHFLLTTPTPIVFQNIDATTTVQETLVAISFPGDRVDGRMFTLTWENQSTVDDTLWIYYPNYTDAQDSSYFVLDASAETIVNCNKAEGDTLSFRKKSVDGISRGIIGGAKNVYYAP